MSILEKAQKMIDRPGSSPSELCRVYLKRIEHIYFKFDQLVIKQKNVSKRALMCNEGVKIK
jgi:translation initiation factor 3 subunit C